MTKKNTTFKAFVFDVDRTLLDTEQFIFQAFVHALKTHNQPSITQAQLNPYMGKPLEVCYQLLAPDFDTNKLADSHRSFQSKNLHLAEPFPHTIQTLKKLKERGIKIAAVTTRSIRTSEKTLELTGLLPFMDTVISKEDVPFDELKPHPRPVLLALQRVNVLPEDAVMVGDAREDVQAGKSAGTRTIGVTYGSAGKDIAESKPDYVINDIDEIIKLV